MNDELRLCPTCGKEASYTDRWGHQLPRGTISMWCACGYHDHIAVYRVSEWQSRPIEDAQAARITELERHLSNLLAVIHGDGGHYEQEHGTAQAVEDAVAKWHDRTQHIDELESAALGVVSAYKITCYNWKKQMDTRIEKLSSLLPEPPQ